MKPETSIFATNLVWILAVLYLAFGIIALTKSIIIRRMTLWFKRIIRMQLGGVVGLIFGILLLYNARFLGIQLFIKIIAIIAIAEGILILLIPKVFVRMIDWWAKAPRWMYLGYGVVAILIAVAFSLAALQVGR